jgi:hypothetical protein
VYKHGMQVRLTEIANLMYAQKADYSAKIQHDDPEDDASTLSETGDLGLVRAPI